MMLDSRIRILTPRGLAVAGAEVDAYNSAVMAEIEAGARAVAKTTGKTVVRVEVEYPGEDWEISGDALEIDLSGDEPRFATLPPYEVAP